MFSVSCMRTGKSLVLSQTELLILLRQFDDGYEKFFKVCNSDNFNVHNKNGDLLYLISKVNRN